MIARMWEVRAAAPQHVDALIDWLRDTALPSIESADHHVHSDLYRSMDRVVVISTWLKRPEDLPEPPPRLVARPPHAWNFTPVERETPAQ